MSTWDKIQNFLKVHDWDGIPELGLVSYVCIHVCGSKSSPKIP